MKPWQILAALLAAALWFLLVVVAPCVDNFGKCPGL
jgi:hypothetical protein